MPVTSKDIADYLGINQSSVSRALQGKLVSEDTIRKVRQAAQELGYRPNVGARIMATGRTSMLGLMIPRAANPYFGRIIEHVQSKALEDGYHVVLACYGEDLDEYTKLVSLFVEQRTVDGLILYPMHDPRILGVLANVKEDDIPVVLMGKTLMRHIHWVNNDCERTFYDIAKHLIGLGHRNIAMVIDFLGFEPEDLQAGQDQRFAGFLQAMHEEGLCFSKKYLRVCRSAMASSYEAATELLNMDHAPTAIIASNDQTAMAVISAARDLGVSIPGDLSITGYDNTQYAEFFNLTTADNLNKNTIEAPLRILKKILSGEATPGEQLTENLNADLVIRSSTGPVPG